MEHKEICRGERQKCIAERGHQCLHKVKVLDGATLALEAISQLFFILLYRERESNGWIKPWYTETPLKVVKE